MMWSLKDCLSCFFWLRFSLSFFTVIGCVEVMLVSIIWNNHAIIVIRNFRGIGEIFIWNKTKIEWPFRAACAKIHKHCILITSMWNVNSQVCQLWTYNHQKIKRFYIIQYETTLIKMAIYCSLMMWSITRIIQKINKLKDVFSKSKGFRLL